jgi:hypothetical protein
VRPGRELLKHYFSCSGGTVGFDRKHFETSYAKLVFLHPMGSAGHVVHFSASRVETSMHYFPCSSGPGEVSIKSARDTLCRTCVFASGGICGSCSAFWCILDVKRLRTIFQARVGPVRIRQKCVRTGYAELECAFRV